MGNYFGIIIVAYSLLLYFVSQGNANRVSSTSNGSSTFNVLDYGAIGDGNQDDSQAFSKAWGDLCDATDDTPTLLVPAGKTFLLTPSSFRGPCKSSSIHVEIQGTIVAPDTIDYWRNCEENSWIVFSDIDNLTVDGSGEFNGKGSIWWNNDVTIDDSKQSCDRPTALRFLDCSGLQLRGLTITDSPEYHTTITGCDHSIISNLFIFAPEDSPNTDGIDVSHSTNVQIRDSIIGTGDDCIAIGRETSSVNISGVTCGPGHGISVGSLGKDGDYAKVEEVHVRNCTFNRTSNGARIKTWQGGSGYARSITFQDIILIEVENPIIIDQYYCNGDHSCDVEKSAVKISDVKYSGFVGNSASQAAISLNCSNTVACNNIIMDSIDITSSNLGEELHAVCENAQGTSNSVVPEVPCLQN